MDRLNKDNPERIARSQNDATRRSCRKHYSNPELRVFGPVGALTQAGTGFNSEAMNMNVSMSPNQQRP